MPHPSTPQDMLDEAKELAKILLCYHSIARNSELAQLKINDPTMHALVQEQIKLIRDADDGS